MWGYRTGYTSAQIELMVADGPIIVYKKDKKEKKAGKPTSASVHKAALEWEQKYGGKEDVTVNFKDIMNL